MADQDYIVPEWLDRDYLQNILNSKYGVSDAQKVLQFSVKVATKKGENYASEMFRIVINTTGAGDHHWILKKPHTEEDRRSIVEPYNFFGKEIKFYTKLLPQLNEILKSSDDFEQLVPELIFCDEERQVLIMQDLRNEGFITGDVYHRMCRESAKVFMRKLGKYHACTMVLNEKMNGDLEKFPFEQFVTVGPFLPYFEHHPFALVEEVKTWGAEFEQMVPKLEKIAQSFCKLAHEATISKRGLNVLAHGDLWYTNLLVKKTRQDVDDVRMIDFQLNGWASLATDILNFAFRALNEEDYEEGIDYLVDIYYDQIASTLRKLNNERVPTRDDISAEIHDKFFHGMIVKLSNDDSIQSSVLPHSLLLGIDVQALCL